MGSGHTPGRRRQRPEPFLEIVLEGRAELDHFEGVVALARRQLHWALSQEVLEVGHELTEPRFAAKRVAGQLHAEEWLAGALRFANVAHGMWLNLSSRSSSAAAELRRFRFSFFRFGWAKKDVRPSCG